MTSRPNPFVGPRSFEIGEHDQFFGRTREIRQLKSLLIAERMVLLHSPSGAGKTSLIRAGLLPEMARERFNVLPIIRVNTALPASSSAGLNRYVYSTILSLEESLDAGQRIPERELSALTLDDYLSRRFRPPDAARSDLMVFDQFEEVLTSAPNDLAGKAAFFEQLGQALTNGNRWALFALREDYLGALAPYTRFLPGRLGCTFRLDLLSKTAALQAIQRPAALAGVEFIDEAAQKLADDLSVTQVQRPDGTLEKEQGLTVEPVQLQVVCFRIFEAQPQDDPQIDLGDLQKAGDVDQALGDYYRVSVERAVQRAGVRERQVRDWFEHELVGAGGIRLQVPMGTDTSKGLSNMAISGLVDAHIIRSENRAGITWFELAHDRLIAPLRKNNTAWYAEHLKPFQQKAEQWAQAGEPKDLLLSGSDLTQAQQDVQAARAEGTLIAPEEAYLRDSEEAWARENLKLYQRQSQVWAAQGRPESLLLRGPELIQADQEVQNLPITADENAFLNASRAAERRAKREKRNARVIRFLAVVAGVAMVFAILLALVAMVQAGIASDQKTVAEQQRATAVAAGLIAREAEATAVVDRLAAVELKNQADQQAQVSFGLGLAFQSQTLPLTRLNTYRQSGLLAIEAAKLAPGIEANQSMHRFLNNPQRPIATFLHDIWVYSVAFSPDGKQVASAGDYDVRIWDIATGMRIATLQQDGTIHSVAFSPDGKQVVTGSDDKKVILWDVASGQEIFTAQHDGAVNSVAFSPDGKQIASGSDDKTVRVWNVATGNEINRILQESPVHSVAFSPDGKQLASGNDDGTARVWDLLTLKEIARVRQDYAVNSVAFSPDGKEIVSGSWDKTVKVWEVATGKAIASMQQDGGVFSVAFSPDGTEVASGSEDKTIRVWDLASGEEIARMQHDGAVNSVAFSPDGEEIASSSVDKTARVWEVAKGKEVAFMQHQWGAVRALVFSPDGKRVATGGDDGTVWVWNVATGELIASMQHDDTIWGVAFSPDGKEVASASGDKTVRVWDAATGKEITRFQHDTAVGAVAFSPDGKEVASGSNDKAVRVWDIATGQVISTMMDNGNIHSVTFSPDGKEIASGEDDGTVRIGDAATGKEITSMHQDNLAYSVAFSPDGKRIVSGSYDYTVTEWEVATGKEIAHMQHDDYVFSVAFSPDGKQIASASWDKTVRIWDADTGKEAARLQHDDSVLAVAFSPDGKWLASGSNNSSVRVWYAGSADLVNAICERVSRNLTQAEWKQYFGDAPYQKTCPNLPVGK